MALAVPAPHDPRFDPSNAMSYDRPRAGVAFDKVSSDERRVPSDECAYELELSSSTKRRYLPSVSDRLVAATLLSPYSCPCSCVPVRRADGGLRLRRYGQVI